ncbi:MAG: class I SAM-dependent methyltransferase [Pirellulales bacterium]|nr:class I SAM-dependent methyltransferase [Pirellulales bacterium]
MKLRDSGMPDEAYWETLFDIPHTLDALGVCRALTDVVELGCGYGTFSIPVARRISGTLFTYDIDSRMIERTKARAANLEVSNIVIHERDVIERGFELPAQSVDAVLLFNILHCEHPELLLSQANQVLRPGGQLLVTHWLYNAQTPRGPALELRPRPLQIIQWANMKGVFNVVGAEIRLPPWHYGLKLLKSGE